MLKETPNIGYFLAEQAVWSYFRSERSDGMDIHAVTMNCRMERLHIAHAYIEIQRMGIDRALVGMVIQELPEEQQIFLRHRYGAKKSFQAIALQMGLPLNRLFAWNKRILSLIELFLFFSIPEDAIWHRMYVINLLHIIDLRLVAFAAHEQEIYKPLYSFLSLQRKRYRHLLDYIEEVSADPSHSVYEQLVTERLKKPNESITDMARRVHFTQSCVSKHLIRYKERAIGIVQSITSLEVDETIFECEAPKRIKEGNVRLYTEKEVMEDLGITEKDIAAAGDVEIE